MREIKFRGKTLGYSEESTWKYGSHVSTYNHTIIDKINQKYVVDDDTIGQFTGLKDKNGVEIYEGDIVKLSNFNFCAEIGKVEWNNERACFRIVGDLFDHSMWICGEDIEVIGNIYDNPELLEVEE